MDAVMHHELDGLESAVDRIIAERDRLLAENARLREALDSLQACASSILEAHGPSFKNSLRLDFDAAIKSARTALSGT